MIETIDKLANRIQTEFDNGIKLEDMKDVMMSYNGTDWMAYQRFSDINYTRNLIFRNDIFEIMILCWNGNQKSPIHDHPSNGCYVKLLQGSLVEESYDIIDDILTLVNTAELTDNAVTYKKGKEGIHRIINPNPEECVTLHVYSPPNYIFNPIMPN